MADSSQLVKALVVKAEDARIQKEMKHMKQAYASLMDVNADLMREYVKRANNHAELLERLKEVNQTIQKAARLRVGEAKGRIIISSRQAVKANDIAQLISVLQSGNSIAQ